MIYDLLGKMAEGGGQRADGRWQGEVRHSNFELQPSNFRPGVFRPGDFRRAVTLIELLVVISIMLLLAAYALPKLEPMSKERKIREAARSVTVFLDRARSRAIETGRPCGVIFARADNTPNAAVMLYQAEVPPPYAGDTLDTRITITSYVSGVLMGTINASSMPAVMSVTPSEGDLIQINNQGPWYIIKAHSVVSGASTLMFTVPLDYQNTLPPWSAGGVALPFKILRQPSLSNTMRSIAQPVSLPVGTAVDLSVSGTDESPFLFSTGGNDVIVMFSPTGSIKQYLAGSTMTDATAPIFFLIGWRDNTTDQKTAREQFDPANPPEFFEDDTPNWQLMTSLWIGLNTQTGLISTAENSFPLNTYTLAKGGIQLKWTQDWKTPALVESRKYARQAQSKGGR